MSDIERSPTPEHELELDDEVTDIEIEPAPAPAPAKPKKVKEDKRKKPRTEKQIAAFELMRQKRKNLIAQKKELTAGYKKQMDHHVKTTGARPPVAVAPLPSVVNNYFYGGDYSNEVSMPENETPRRVSRRVSRPEPEPEPEQVPEPEEYRAREYEEPPTPPVQIYFG